MPTPNPPAPERARPPRASRLGLTAFGVLLAAGSAVADAIAPKGDAVYREKCASCHGAAGEGSDEYPRELAGDRSVPQLARLIARTMPEDDPGTCVGGEAEAVAAYVHERFYSREARERNKPPRVELTRLTVRQYQNAAADLLGGFRGPGSWGEARGLRGQYYKKGNLSNDKERAIDRVDPEVRFDWGDSAPEADQFDPAEFSARWEGSVLAPETGDYEFVVRTEHATRLWVNDPKTPLIDAWVKSGDGNEYRGTVRLLGGRAYPIKLHFSKAKQGVNDKKKRKPAPASIALLWTLPRRVPEVIPSRNLAPVNNPETFVVAAPFPPDDRSVGYERGTSVSKAWDQAATDAAVETAAYVLAHLRELTGVKDKATPGDREHRLREFGHKFAERAFRRPLTNEQKALYVDRQFDEAADPEAAVKRVVLLVLKSPRFLYHHQEATGRPDGFDVASRLSFGLWDSLPDPPLAEAAASGKLADPGEVTRQAERMAGDLRARAKVRAFLLQWLRVEQAPDIAKDPKAFPDFDPAVVSDLRTSLDLFLDDVVWGEGSDYRRLLTSDELYLNGRLAKFYGADLPADAPFQKVKLDPEHRAGVLSHPYMLSTFAYTSTSSPIHRGVFLARSVLGRGLKPPPEAVAPLAPDLHAGLSTRERVALQTSPAACVTCHGMINPLGFGLERFDAVGRFRAEEKGKPVDATGSYEPPSGDPRPFEGARGLGALLAESDEAHGAFVEQLFHHLVKQPVRAYGPRTASGLKKAFASSKFNVKALVVESVKTSALAGRPAPGGLADRRTP